MTFSLYEINFFLYCLRNDLCIIHIVLFGSKFAQLLESEAEGICEGGLNWGWLSSARWTL